MSTEEQIRQWVRDEQARLDLERQAACDHAQSGTLHSDGTVTCDQCNKQVTLADAGLGRKTGANSSL